MVKRLVLLLLRGSFLHRLLRGCFFRCHSDLLVIQAAGDARAHGSLVSALRPFSRLARLPVGVLGTPTTVSEP